jgi:hypothetical protein
MKIEHLAAMQINVPVWFARDDFRAYLNGPLATTWHRKRKGRRPNEMSDVFVVYDHGDSSDFVRFEPDRAGSFPSDLREELRRIAAAEGFDYGIIRLTNCEE